MIFFLSLHWTAHPVAEVSKSTASMARTIGIAVSKSTASMARTIGIAVSKSTASMARTIGFAVGCAAAYIVLVVTTPA